MNPSLRDVRTPADPQDFESLYDRPAKPPRGFSVTKDVGGTTVICQFQDYAEPASRASTSGYRAYFVPASCGTAAEMWTVARRAAAVKVGRLAASVPATGRGEWIKVTSVDFVGKEGFYLAVGINRRGVESEPTIAFPSPYNP